MKALSKDEIWIKSNREPGGLRDFMDDIVDLARQGMIPEDEAVRIPPVEEWPDCVDNGGKIYGVGVVFTSFEDEDEFNDKWGERAIKYIPRPVPAWTPKSGDKVFGKSGDLQVIVGAVLRVPEHGRWIEVVQGSYVSPFDYGNLKPFSPEKIGLRWEEI